LIPLENQNFLDRELTVVHDGLAQGIWDGCGKAVQDAKTGLHDLVEHPVTTSVNYVENHWQDFAAGAIITAIGPKGALLNTALFAYASRDVWAPAGMAMINAASSDADAGKLATGLRQDETHAVSGFASSLPLTMLGSSFAKAGTTALLGENMTLSDVARGKVSLDDVSTNYWNLRDKISPPKMKVLLTDIDGTMAPFADYFAPAVRDNVRKMSAEQGVPELSIYKAIGGVMDKYRTHDYPWSLEQSGLLDRFKMTPDQFTQQIVEPFWQHMDQMREQHLKPFPNVEQTLQTLRDNDVRIIARSDAPFFIAKARLKTMGLDKYVDELYALDYHVPDINDLDHPSLFEHGSQRVRSLMSEPDNFERSQVLPREFEKPAVGNTAERLQELGVRPSQVAMIGDSRVKDGGFAKNLGVKFYYALFGANPASEYTQIFRTLASGADGGKPTSNFSDTVLGQAHKVYPPIFKEAASYKDILAELNPPGINYKVLRNTLAPSYKGLIGTNLYPGQQDGKDNLVPKAI